jgi:hypothetical protein
VANSDNENLLFRLVVASICYGLLYDDPDCDRFRPIPSSVLPILVVEILPIIYPNTFHILELKKIILIRSKTADKKSKYLLGMFCLTFCNPLLFNIQNGIEVFGPSIATEYEIIQIYLFLYINIFIFILVSILFA